MTVVFSTYQSIDAVSKAQKAGLPEFDLIICDEAHRTTGVTLTGEDESPLRQGARRELPQGQEAALHDRHAAHLRRRRQEQGQGSRRRTRVDGRREHCSARSFTASASAKPSASRLLSDYKVLVLAVDEKYVSKTFQKQIADKNSELNLDDAVKITGCWNGLEKRFEAAHRRDADLQGDVQPMRRAVAFSRSIKDSKAFVEQFGQIVAAYKENHPDADRLLEVEADHVDGTFDALRRGALLDWLKAESPANTCRILSNARCLSEGVDVPALDAVLFLNPRNSRHRRGAVRRPRHAPGRGQALRLHHPAHRHPRRHNARRGAEGQREVQSRLAGAPGPARPRRPLQRHDQPTRTEQEAAPTTSRSSAWAADRTTATAASRRRQQAQGARGSGRLRLPQPRRMEGRHLRQDGPEGRRPRLLGNLGPRHRRDRRDAHHPHQGAPGRPEVEAREGVRRVPEGLADKPQPRRHARRRHRDARAAPDHQAGVRCALRQLRLHAEEPRQPVDAEDARRAARAALEKETATLEKFYASVRDRAKGIDNAEGRQKVVIELYDEFFRTAFPRMAERLGIVYTPVEVVDFIIRSVEDVLRDEFNSGLGEKDVHIIDPFTGTGTFLVRLLQCGLIPPEKLLHKYKHELHANEIVLLAYYIAAINIEETFHGLRAGARARTTTCRSKASA